jgi:hypothetical protein
MKARNKYRLVLAESHKGNALPALLRRRVDRTAPPKLMVSPHLVLRALKATMGAKQLIEQIPNLAKSQFWVPIATFSVCQKAGTAAYLDVWDADHFDYFTDMQHCLTDCRIWFSADGYGYWDSPQTKTGRINCYFKAPSPGNYICNVQLQSYGGLAQVECLLDEFSYGPLPFNGPISQPYAASLNAGYHSFRIRQVSGSFFFVSLTVWKV